MTLRTTDLGLTLIKTFEGCKLKAYRCPAGVLTIGYGHTNAAGGMQFTAGKTINKATAEKLLREDIDRFEDGVERLIGDVRLEPAQFDALVSLAFNIGLGAFSRSTLLRKVKSGRLDDVPAQIMRWNKVKGEAVKGLTRRRRAEAALWRGDLAEAERYAGVEFGAMPQQVDEPKPPKGMADSTIGNGAVIVGTGGAIAPTVEVAKQAKEAVETGKDLWDVALSAGPWLLLLIVIVCVAAYIWLERRKKLVEEHV